MLVSTIVLDLSLLFDDVLFCLPFRWCPCMAINVSVQYDGGFLLDIILLTQCYYHRGTRLNAMKRFCIFSYWSHLNVLTFFPPDWGMLRSSRCIQIFLQTFVHGSLLYVHICVTTAVSVHIMYYECSSTNMAIQVLCTMMSAVLLSCSFSSTNECPRIK